MKPILFLILMLAIIYPGDLIGQTNGQKTSPQLPEGTYYFNLPLKTMGGNQLWTDHFHFHKYRIQQNALTGHHRLIDPNNVRLAWGDYAACLKKLVVVSREKKIPPMRGEVTIVLHGLTRTRSTMKSLAKFLEENGDAQVLNVSYASTRMSIDKHAAALSNIIQGMPEVTKINFVGHSMGNIVVRHYLGSELSENETRFNRMVMLGPPNNGSRFATALKNNVLFKTFWGVSAQQLAEGGFDELESRLGTPEFEFGIIAGAQPDDASFKNPLLGDGQNDMVVTVEETKLPGATDFYQRPFLHSTMMKHEEVHEATLNFLENGYFVAADKKKPLQRTSRSLESQKR